MVEKSSIFSHLMQMYSICLSPCKLGGSRKYPYPHHRENWKFRRGGGVGSKTQEIPEGRGVGQSL